MADRDLDGIAPALAASLARGLEIARSLHQRKAGALHVLAAIAEDPRVVRVWRSRGQDVDANVQRISALARHAETAWGSPPQAVNYDSKLLDQIRAVGIVPGSGYGLGRFVEAVLYRDIGLRDEEWTEASDIFDRECAKRLVASESGPSGHTEHTAVAGGIGQTVSALARFAKRLESGREGVGAVPIPDVQRALRRSVTRRYRPHVAMVGGSGTGKTTQVKAFVDAAVEGEQPLTVWRVPCGEFVSGFAGRKDLVAALQSLIREAGAQGDTILFLDDLHVLAQGTGGGGANVMTAIKESLVDTPVRLWAATTLEGFEKNVAEDETVGSLFSVIEIGEPDEDVCLEIAMRHARQLESDLGVRFEPEIWPVVYSLCRRFLPSECFPAKMLHVADAAAHESLSDDAERAPAVNQSHVQKAVSQLAKVPISTLTEYEQERLRGLEEFLNERVFSQQPATSAVTRAVRMLRLGLKNKKRTGGAFLFVGPPGTGKTELAKALAEFLGGGEDKLVRFNMSEFQTPESYQRLIGPPPGYVGYDAGGELTNALRHNPYSIVLFDEIEKGSSRVFDLFLQVLSDGHLTDNKGRIVDCKNSVFVMTSNAIAETRDKSIESLRAELKAYRDPFRQASTGPTFRPEFLDRLEVIPFGHLDRSTLRAIADREIDQILAQAAFGGILDCSIHIHPSTLDWLLDQILESEGGARSIQRVVESRVARFIAERFLDETLKRGMNYEVRLGDDSEFVVEAIPTDREERCDADLP